MHYMCSALVGYTKQRYWKWARVQKGVDSVASVHNIGILFDNTNMQRTESFELCNAMQCESIKFDDVNFVQTIYWFMVGSFVRLQQLDTLSSVVTNSRPLKLMVTEPYESFSRSFCSAFLFIFLLFCLSVFQPCVRSVSFRLNKWPLH